MSVSPKYLRRILMQYEMDEPYFSMGGSPDVNKLPTEEEFERYLGEPHSGDCINLPSPCMRCFAEEINHKAEWICQKLKLSKVKEK